MSDGGARARDLNVLAAGSAKIGAPASHQEEDHRRDLRWLLGSISVDEFFERYYEKRFLHLADRDVGYYEPIFSADAFEQLVYQSHDAVRANLTCIRTVKIESRIITEREVGVPARFFSKSLLSSLQAILNDGYSLVVMHVNQNWLPLARLLHELEVFFLNPLDTVLFYSPPKIQGAPPHFDPYDNYILQIAGEKHWKIFNPKVVLPLNSQLRSVSDESLGDPVAELRMRPGDLLYLPRGVIHETSCGEEPSIHLTLYNYAYRWRDVLCDIIERLAEQEVALRRSVPLSVSREIACGASAEEAGVSDTLASLLHYCLANVATAGSIGRHARRLVDNLLPLELGNVDTHLQGELDGSQCVAKRQGMVCYLYDEGDNVVIGFPGGKLSGPASIKPLLQFIARASEPFLLSELPGALSLRSKEAVVRRLVREGLLFFPAA